MSERPNDRLIVMRNDAGEVSLVMFWCPGCKRLHPYNVPRWTFNGNFDQPTFSPSLRVLGGPPERETTCHLHVQDGLLKYCSDCPHEYNGKTVPMVPIPEGEW